MKRLHLFELEDQAWCPRLIRDAVTDYLQFSLTRFKPYSAMVTLLVKALQQTGAEQIIDLCSGATGPWLWLQPALDQAGVKVSVCLTDKYPNPQALQKFNLAQNRIRYYPEPVDAMQVSNELHGFRTMFTAFHHFDPAQARAVLADAVRKGQGIGVFEITARRPLPFFCTLLSPLVVLCFTPWIRPFRWGRLFWTYLAPLVPLVTLCDGLVSCLRTYTVPELRELTAGLGADHYFWEVGTIKGKAAPVPVTYLIGLPKHPTSNPVDSVRRTF